MRLLSLSGVGKPFRRALLQRFEINPDSVVTAKPLQRYEPRRGSGQFVHFRE